MGKIRHRWQLPMPKAGLSWMIQITAIILAARNKTLSPRAGGGYRAVVASDGKVDQGMIVFM